MWVDTLAGCAYNSSSRTAGGGQALRIRAKELRRTRKRAETRRKARLREAAEQVKKKQR
jgi:hypothetical protein